MIKSMPVSIKHMGNPNDPVFGAVIETYDYSEMVKCPCFEAVVKFKNDRFLTSTGTYFSTGYQKYSFLAEHKGEYLYWDIVELIKFAWANKELFEQWHKYQYPNDPMR